MSTAPSGSVLLSGGTIIAFDEKAEALDVIRNGALLVTGDRIAGIFDTALPSNLPPDVEIVDCTNKIISPGFIDTHRHGWQTALKTLGANSSMPEYVARFTTGSASTFYTAEDVYIGQLAGLLEGLNAGVTTALDHAHHTWSKDTVKAGLQGSIDSGARVYWNHAFTAQEGYPILEQIANFKELKSSQSSSDDLTTIGVAYDFFTHAPREEIEAVMSLTKYAKLKTVESSCCS